MREYKVTLKFKRETTGDLFDIYCEAQNMKEVREIIKEEYPSCTPVVIKRA